jgi:antitoxin HicB
MRAYPVNLRKDGKFILVTFPDIPEAITQGDDRSHALEMAKEVLELAMEFYFEDRRPVPEPSKAKRGQEVVELSASLSAKVLLLNEMLRQKVRPAELARRIGTTPQEVNRLTNIRHTSRIDGIAGALKALGKTMEIRAV